jgi:hypothetical protein
MLSAEYIDEKKKKRKYKERRKKRVPALPNEVVVIKNADKDTGGWVETWDKPKSRSAGHLPHSFRLLALGGVSRGKTNYMKNLFLRHQSSSKKFKKLYVITCDLSSREWDDCEPTEILDHMPDISLFEDGSQKMLVIIDDYEFERCSKDELRKLTTLFRMISSHKNVSIMCSYQSFFHCPSIARKTANVFILYKPTSDGELHTIANRVGIKYDVLYNLFRKHCTEYHDHIMLDMTPNSPYPIRKNIYEVIQTGKPAQSDSESDS